MMMAQDEVVGGTPTDGVHAETSVGDATIEDRPKTWPRKRSRTTCERTLKGELVGLSMIS